VAHKIIKYLQIFSIVLLYLFFYYAKKHRKKKNLLQLRNLYPILFLSLHFLLSTFLALDSTTKQNTDLFRSFASLLFYRIEKKTEAKAAVQPRQLSILALLTSIKRNLKHWFSNIRLLWDFIDK